MGSNAFVCSDKAADTLVRLAAKVYIMRGRVVDRDNLAEIRAQAKAAGSLAEVQAMFAKVNRELGFDRDTSPATFQQRGLIRRLGGGIVGANDGLTFEEASTMIRELKAARDARRSAKDGE